MSKTLVIVESPKKARTIQQILGTDAYQVLASGGHICDLPVDELGVDTDTFELTYKLTDRGKQSFTRLKAAAARASEVILATDPDR
ncbi:DNA topoisomerase I, partial [Burkholderia cenocepacia]